MTILKVFMTCKTTVGDPNVYKDVQGVQGLTGYTLMCSNSIQGCAWYKRVYKGVIQGCAGYTMVCRVYKGAHCIQGCAEC